MATTCVLGLLFLIASVAGFSGGPPDSVCDTLRPNHRGDPSAGNGGYTITTDLNPNPSLTGYQYSAGQTYTGEVASIDLCYDMSIFTQLLSMEL